MSDPQRLCLKEAVASRDSNLKLLFNAREACIGPIPLYFRKPDQVPLFQFCFPTKKKKLFVQFSTSTVLNQTKAQYVDFDLSLPGSFLMVKKPTPEDDCFAIVIQIPPNFGGRVLEAFGQETVYLVNDRMLNRKTDMFYAQRNLVLIIGKMKEVGPDVYMKAELPNGSTCYLNAEDTYNFFMTDIRDYFTSTMIARSTGGTNITHNSVEQISQANFDEFLLEFGIARVDLLNNGEIVMNYFDSNPNPNSYMVKTKVIPPRNSENEQTVPVNSKAAAGNILHLPSKRGASIKGEAVVPSSSQNSSQSSTTGTDISCCIVQVPKDIDMEECYVELLDDGRQMLHAPQAIHESLAYQDAPVFEQHIASWQFGEAPVEKGEPEEPSTHSLNESSNGQGDSAAARDEVKVLNDVSSPPPREPMTPVTSTTQSLLDLTLLAQAKTPTFVPFPVPLQVAPPEPLINLHTLQQSQPSSQSLYSQRPPQQSLTGFPKVAQLLSIPPPPSPPPLPPLPQTSRQSTYTPYPSLLKKVQPSVPLPPAPPAAAQPPRPISVAKSMSPMKKARILPPFERADGDLTVKEFLIRKQMEQKRSSTTPKPQPPGSNELVNIVDDDEETPAPPPPPQSKPKAAHQSAPIRHRSTIVIKDTDVVTTYPPLKYREIHPQTVALSMKDIRTMDPSDMINDHIIEFYMTKIKCVCMNDDLRKRTHFFNSFLFSALTKKMPRLKPNSIERIYDLNMNLYKEGFAIVKKWTKKVDIFTKDYVILPINEEFHWFVALIVNPRGAIVPGGDQPVPEDQQLSHILWLDSMTGMDSRRQKFMQDIVVTYLKMEFEDKKERVCADLQLPQDVQFDTSRVRSIRPYNLPIQTNLLDCGAYALHFLETFFGDSRPLPYEKLVNNFDWREEYPLSEYCVKMMRFKMYAELVKSTNPEQRSRLYYYEQERRTGISICRNYKRGISAAYTRKRRRVSRPRARAISLFEYSCDNPSQLGNNPTLREVRQKVPPFRDIPLLW